MTGAHAIQGVALVAQLVIFEMCRRVNRRSAAINRETAALLASLTPKPPPIVITVGTKGTGKSIAFEQLTAGDARVPGGRSRRFDSEREEREE